MTASELQTKLDELLRLPAETEWVEFKAAKANFDSDDFGKYFAALCNEANLKGESGAWLVFGVQDKPRKVIGTQFRPHRANLDNLKQEVAQHTTSRIAAITGDKAQYIRNRAFDTQHYKQMILDFIREFGSATRKDVDDLLRGKLSDLLTEKQKAYWTGNLLSSMARKDGSIRNQGARRSPKWVLMKK